MPEQFWTVGELAAELGTTARALRFYEDKGLIAPKRAGQTRIYDHRDRARLLLILRGKRLGFSLREIREWLSLYEGEVDRPSRTRNWLERIDQRIRRLEQQRRDLDRTLAELAELRAQALARLAGCGAEAAAATPPLLPSSPEASASADGR
ncbi:HTH-type transcriptional regulator CueR [bacterium HR40]|nr:HTH-type transcriptional regulator CueR [bacterium HR40]